MIWTPCRDLRSPQLPPGDPRPDLLANPNNPTETWIDAPALEPFSRQGAENVIVVLD